jgi:hypothetical protein
VPGSIPFKLTVNAPARPVDPVCDQASQQQLDERMAEERWRQRLEERRASEARAQARASRARGSVHVASSREGQQARPCAQEQDQEQRGQREREGWTGTGEEVEGMSVSMMKKELQACGISTHGFVEKHEFVQALKHARTKHEVRDKMRGDAAEEIGSEGGRGGGGRQERQERQEKQGRVEPHETSRSQGRGGGGGAQEQETVGDETLEETLRIWETEGLSEQEAACIQSVLEMSLNHSRNSRNSHSSSRRDSASGEGGGEEEDWELEQALALSRQMQEEQPSCDEGVGSRVWETHRAQASDGGEGGGRGGGDGTGWVSFDAEADAEGEEQGNKGSEEERRRGEEERERLEREVREKTALVASLQEEVRQMRAEVQRLIRQEKDTQAAQHNPGIRDMAQTLTHMEVPLGFRL